MIRPGPHSCPFAHRSVQPYSCVLWLPKNRKERMVPLPDEVGLRLAGRSAADAAAFAGPR